MYYDYLEAIKADVLDYIKAEVDLSEYITMEDLVDTLNEELWACDSVTGNASGSYTFNAYKAEEYICHNLDLLFEAMREFGCEYDCLEKGAEWCDVTIRCYLLEQAISEAMKEIEADFEAAHDTNE